MTYTKSTSGFHLTARISLVFIALMILSGSISWAADQYVRAGANGTGSDWANAYGKLPATLVRGNTYYVADGSYPGYNFSTPVSGATTITVKKATASAHGTSTGWDSSYGDGVATWGPMSANTSYIIFDGVTGSGKTGHGFEIYDATGSADLFEVGNSASYITVSHCNMHYASRDVKPADAFYMNTPADHITISNNYIHDISSCALLMRYCTNILFERNWVARNKSSAAYHAEGVSNHGGSNFVFRYNTWEDIEGTGVIINLYAPSSNWEVYGNVFFETGLAGGLGQGIMTNNGGGNESPINGLKFYNNSAYHLSGNSSGVRVWGSTGNGDINVYNNLWYECVAVGFNQVTHDYNEFHNCTFTFEYNSNPGAHDKITTGDPYVSTSGTDFCLNAATATGMSLAAPYNVDMDGKLRGADGVWDRGAFEFGGTGGPVPTPNPTPTPTPAMSSVDSDWIQYR